MSFFDRFRRYPELREVVVTTNVGTAVRGLLWRHRGPYLVLRQATVLDERGRRMERQVEVDEILLPIAKIDYVQVL